MSRYALPLVHQATGDAFSRTVWECLPPDPVGRTIVALANPLLGRLSPDSRVGALVAHLLNDSVARGVRSGVRAIRQRGEPR